jgi:hypothetical protein
MFVYTIAPVMAVFSLGSALNCSAVSLRVHGLLSTLSLCLRDIREGQIGDINLSFRLPVAPPFRPIIALSDYFKASAFVALQVGGDTVYRSLLGSRMPRLNLDPIIVLYPNRTVGYAVPGMRRLFALEQEEQLLVSGLMDVLGRHYKDSGLSETVLIPNVYLPQRFDNRRLRDGAGALFALGPITFEGVDGATLSITSHIDAEGVVTYQNFHVVSRTANTFTHYETVRHETTQKRLLGKNKTSVDYEQVAVRERQPGNETRARGERYIGVNHVHRSGANDSLGEDGLRVEGATSFVDEAIVRTVIGPVQSDRQRGLLGGGTRTTYQPVTQQAIGSQINSLGPVYIESALGIFEATHFGQSPANLQVTELHYHALLRAMEARDREIAEGLRQAKRTSKRKRRQGTMWLLISLPVSYYVGGLVSAWLEGALGVTVSATVVNGVTTAAASASFGQTVAIVGTAAAVGGGVSAAIQGQAILKGALNAAPFAIAGNLVANSSVLMDSEAMTKTLAQTATASALHACLHGRLSLENLLITFGAAAAAEGVVPSSANDSMGREVFRTATSTTVMALLGNGTLQSLASSLMAAGVGASLGRIAAKW